MKHLMSNDHIVRDPVARDDDLVRWPPVGGDVVSAVPEMPALALHVPSHAIEVALPTGTCLDFSPPRAIDRWRIISLDHTDRSRAKRLAACDDRAERDQQEAETGFQEPSQHATQAQLNAASGSSSEPTEDVRGWFSEGIQLPHAGPMFERALETKNANALAVAHWRASRSVAPNEGVELESMTGLAPQSVVG